MTLQEDWRQRREGRKAAHLHSAHLVLMYSFAFIFFVAVFQASCKTFAKDSHFQSKPKSQGTVVVRLIWEYFFLFCFSEISCWGYKAPCNFQQWKVDQFFCLEKKTNLIFIFPYLIFALACTFLLSSSHMLLFVSVVKDFYSGFFFFLRLWAMWSLTWI